jgi:hypothetical protein
MNRLLVICGMAVGLAGCDLPVSSSKPIVDSPGGSTANFIGTVDGCRLWSVDAGNFYFANCQSGITSTGWKRRSGKTSRYLSASTDYEDRP